MTMDETKQTLTELEGLKRSIDSMYWRAVIEDTITLIKKPMTARGIISQTDEEVLVGIVMTLTGGSANPAVVRAQIKRVREEDKS